MSDNIYRKATNTLELFNGRIADAYTKAQTDAKIALISTSHIGMVIHSTTLDTEEKVIAIYGGTSWSKIEGRFLLGQSSDYEINSTGGNKDAIVPYHNHSIPSLSGSAASNGAHTHKVAESDGTGADSMSVKTGGNVTSYLFGTTAYPTLSAQSAGAHTHSVTTNANNTGYVGTNGNITDANMPPYKVVYIWERTE